MKAPRLRGRRRDPAAGGLPFDDREIESRLVWIWSPARSGSTWFLQLLSHPLKLVDSRADPDDRLGFWVPPSWQGLVDAIPVDTTFIANHLVPLSGEETYDENWSPITFASGTGLTERANYFFSPQYEDVWRPELRRMVLTRFHRLMERTAEVHRTTDPLVLLKEVTGSHGADLVMSLFPRSQMIFLVRDGRDVVDSQTAAYQPGGWHPVTSFESDAERLDFVRRRSRAWVGDMMTIGRAFERHPPDRRWRVHYEELLSDTRGVLRPLVDWLGLERGPKWLERAIEVNAFEAVAAEHRGPRKFFRSASPGAWAENLSSEEQQVAVEIMGEKLVELGYSLEETRQAPERTLDLEPDSKAGDRPDDVLETPARLGAPPDQA